jgi:two-component system OmpR family response regulator
MRILVVEDQPDLHRLLRGFLEDAGYAVDGAFDGQEGLAKAMTYPYDVIVLDIMLPKLDGKQVLDELRRHRKTPVLILSARDGLRDRVDGLDLGADDYLVKPFERVELLARLRAIIRRAAGHARSTIEFHGILLDTRSKTVARGDELIALTSREYRLLEYLAINLNRVVSREELLDHLSDEIDESNSNVLDVYISYLRKKLGPEVIETRRGLGYIIMVQR